MDFGANKRPIEGAFGGSILETFLVLIENGTKNHGKNSIS